MELANRPKLFYYFSLLLVVFIWGLDPLVMTYLYRYYSASVLTAIGALASLFLFLPLCVGKLHRLDLRYLKVAVPISALNSLACLVQKIGLQYTTPANCAFLEHLSCAVVPFGVWIVIKKRPAPPQLCAAALCLGGCFVLCGADFFGGGHAVGDLLCALAGILLGVCVVAVGAYAKGLDPMLYICVHMLTYFLISLFSALLLQAVRIGGAPAEPLHFTPSPLFLLLAVLFGLLSIGVCWLLKNIAVVHTDPTAVAIISPMAAVISGVISVLAGLDRLTPSLLIGGGLILAAILLSGICEALLEKRKSTE